VKGFNTHWLGWNHLDDGSITRLDKLWRVFKFLTRTTINLFDEFSKLASNVSSVAIKNWRVSGSDLSRVVENDDLSIEGGSFLGWVVLGVGTDHTTTDILDGNVLDVESDIVSWNTLFEGFVVHFNGLDFSSDHSRGKTTTIPALMTPVSTRPTGTVPIPPILYTS